MVFLCPADSIANLAVVGLGAGRRNSGQPARRQRGPFMHEVARAEPVADHRLEQRYFDATAFDGVSAARMKYAALRRLQRARQLTGDRLGSGPIRGVDVGGRSQQCLRIGMVRPIEECGSFGQLNDPPEIHHGNAVGDVPHQAQIMRDQNNGEMQRSLQLQQEVDDLARG